MRVLFITHTRVGDAILSTGLLAHLVDAYPGVRLTIACGPAAAPLFGTVPEVERVIVMRKGRFGAHWWRLWAACVGTWWDMVIDLRGSAMAWLLPTLRRRVPGKDRGGHRVRRLAGLIGRADDPPAPRLWTARAHDELAARLVPEGAPVLAVGPTANWVGKQWRAENFAELIARLTGPDGILPRGRVALFGGKDERLAANPVIASVPRERRIDLVGKTDLLTAYACLRRCAFYVGNDSGLMHLAAAAGVPTLGLFGPTLDELYGPWGERCAVVRTAVPYLELFGPDHGAAFDHASCGTLMDSLTVDMAERAARDLWARVAEAAA